jgi:hypothetical protein
MKPENKTEHDVTQSRSTAELGGETLWMHCLFLCMDAAKRNGQPTVEFSDVDKMVIEKSKTVLMTPNVELRGGATQWRSPA